MISTIGSRASRAGAGPATAKESGLAHAEGEPLGVLLEALEHDSDVAIVYAGKRGITHRVISPIEVDDARVVAWCHLRDDKRAFWLDSILAAGHAP